MRLNKLVIVLIIMVLFLISITACADKGMDFNDLIILANDQVDAPVGTYTIPFTINNLNKYTEELGVVVNIIVEDNDNIILNLMGNTFIVEADKVYTVTINVSDNEGNVKTKVFTITAVTTPIITYTVSYDLNGATQSDIISEEVISGSLATEPTNILTKDGYIFIGWYKDNLGLQEWNFDTEIISSNITIYAGWELILTEWIGDYLFTNLIVEDDSIIDNYELLQRVLIKGNYEHFNDGNPDEAGIIYSSINTNPKNKGADVIRVKGAINTEAIDNPFEAKSLSLMENTKYYIRGYVISSDIIIYTEVIEYDTYELVSMGNQVGCTYIVSGGVYTIDNGDLITNPYKDIQIDNGYTATNEGEIVNSSHLYYSKSGYNSLITTETATGNKYLHIYKVVIIKPSVQLSLEHIENIGTEDNEGVRINYNVESNPNFNYIIQEAGILYSTSNMLLEINYPYVERTSAYVYNSEDNEFYNTYSISNNNNLDIFIRGYYKSDNKYSYSNNVTKLVYGLIEGQTSGYKIDSNYLVNETYTNSSYSFSIGAGQIEITKILPSINDSTIYNCDFTIENSGVYRVVNVPLVNSITRLEIDKNPPIILGVLTGLGPVIPECYEANVTMYLIKDNGDEKDFASGVKITEAGHYILIALDSLGNRDEAEFVINATNS